MLLRLVTATALTLTLLASGVTLVAGSGGGLLWLPAAFVVAIEEFLAARPDPRLTLALLLTSDALIAEKPKKEDKKGGGEHDDLY